LTRTLEPVAREEPRESRNYRSSATIRDHHTRRGQEILEEAERHFARRWRSCAVKRGDWRTREAVAWAVWRETIVPQKWIAEALGQKPAANANQHIRRFARESEGPFPVRVRKWKRKRSRNVA